MTMQTKVTNFVTFVLQEVAAQGFDFGKLLASQNNLLSNTSNNVKKLAKTERKLAAQYILGVATA